MGKFDKFNLSLAGSTNLIIATANLILFQQIYAIFSDFTQYLVVGGGVSDRISAI